VWSSSQVSLLGVLVSRHIFQVEGLDRFPPKQAKRFVGWGFFLFLKGQGFFL